MKSVAVLTSDIFLFKKIALSLDDCEVTLVGSEWEGTSADALFCDIDTYPVCPDQAVKMSRRAECDLPIPFSLGAPRKFLSRREAALIPERRTVLLRGREIRLTELEYALFSLIVNAKGDAVSREEILKRVWRSDAADGIVNVYVHYLREKLESDGERVIGASRGRGYSLTAKYAKLFGGGPNDA